VGGRLPIKASARIIAATHRDLRQSVRQGLFREDLFYRLNVVPIRMPPLRERGEDIAELLLHFLDRAEAEGLPRKRLDAEAMAVLKGHAWPGNVRELENLVRRLGALYSQDVIGAEVVRRELSAETPAETPAEGTDATPEAAGDSSIGAAVERHLRAYFAAHERDLPASGLHGRVVREVERPLIELSLAVTGGNQIKAAKMLGLNRNTLRKKIRELDIRVIRGLK
jgi:two-component system nitrogen regulation response regulator GlnG